MIKDTDCLILCGGKGSRLKELTGNIPKPMIRIGKRVFLDILIGYLHSAGFKRFILGLGYGADYIREYYSKNKLAGIEIVFSKESRPLGTGGAVKKAGRLIKSEDFMVINGDSFSDFSLRGFFDFYKKKKAKVAILLKEMKDNKDYGFVAVNANSEVTLFNEKVQRKKNSYINSGVYLFNKEIFSVMPKKPVFSLEYDFFPKIIGKGVYGYKGKSLFIDIGTPERYRKAKNYFLGKKRVLN